MMARRGKLIDVSYDRLSMLPIDVIHHILTYLPTKNVAQMSVLSKRWEHIWYSHPFFHLNSSFFPGEFLPNPELIDAIVIHKLQKFSMHKFDLQEFKLSLSLQRYQNFLEKWLTFAAENNVKELELDNINPTRKFTLPCMIIISAAKSLTSLKLTGCKMGQLPETCLLEFSSLKKLFLANIKDNNGIVQRIIMGCRSLNDIYLEDCWGTSVSVTNRLVALQELSITASLTASFCFVNASRTLKSLSLTNVVFRSIHFGDQNFPQLVKLWLRSCTCYGKVRISSNRLENLSLDSIHLFESIEIRTPNLLSLNYEIRVTEFGPLTRLPLRNSIPNDCYVSVTIGFDNEHFDASRFIDILDYLERQRETNRLSLYIHTQMGEAHLPNVHTIPIPRSAPKLEVLFVDLREHDGENMMKSSDLATLFNGLIWCCNPEIIYLSCHQILADKVSKFIYRKLMKKEPARGSSSQRNGYRRRFVRFARLLTSEDYHMCFDPDSLIEFEAVNPSENKRVLFEMFCNFD